MKLKVWQIILVVLVFGGAMAVAIQAGTEWRQNQGPDMLRVSQAGDLYAQFRNRIFVYGREGVYRNTIHLAQWGVEQSTGGFDVFSNGDLLMLEGSHQQGTLLNVAHLPADGKSINRQQGCCGIGSPVGALFA